MPLLPSMPVDLTFMDDTGASVMQINQSDLQHLINCNRDPQQNDPPLPPLLGVMPLVVANGTIDHLICRRFEINMWDSTTRTYMSLLWHPVQVVIFDDTNTQAQTRLNGPWARHRMYSASAPDGSSYTYFSDVHPASSLIVPTVNPAQIPPLLPDLPVLPVGGSPGGTGGGKAVP